MSSFFHSLNECTGVFLLIIAFAISSIARSVGKIATELECLHEDYDRTTDAHERHHQKLMNDAGL